MEQRGRALTENELSKLVVELCLKIHRKFGPGLFESVYEEIFCYELKKMQLAFQRQQDIPLIHEELIIQRSFRADVIIENKVIVELKSVEELVDIHYKQVQTYLKLTGLKLGMLINFNVALMKLGLHRIVNNL
jgi:GxxExxY protein